MAQRLTLMAVIALFSVSVQAQKSPPGRSPCDGGGGPNPMFTVSTGNPVVLTFQHATSLLLRAPVVTTSGNNITVVQVMFSPPPAPLPNFEFPTS